MLTTSVWHLFEPNSAAGMGIARAVPQRRFTLRQTNMEMGVHPFSKRNYHLLHSPGTQCMVYLPTFGQFKV